MPDLIRHALPFAAVLAVIIGCVVVARRADHEAATHAPATCLPARCYCEAIAATGVRHPIDAWSSLAPALAGAACLASARRRPTTGRSPIARSRAPGVLLGLAACAIALFSFYYHATLGHRQGQQLELLDLHPRTGRHRPAGRQLDNPVSEDP